MLARFIILAAVFGLCLAMPAGVAVAFEEPPDAPAAQAPVPENPPPPQAGWDEDQQPPGPRGRHQRMRPPRRGDMQPGQMPPRRGDMRSRSEKGGPRHGQQPIGMGVMDPSRNPSRVTDPRFVGGQSMGMMGIDEDRALAFDPMRNADPEIYKLHKQDRDFGRKTMQLCEQYRRAPEELKAEMKKQLEELVTQHFEIRQQRRRLELERMQEVLKRLEEAINSRQENREEIINRRIMKLTGQKDPLDF